MENNFVLKAQMLSVKQTIINAFRYYQSRFKLISGIVALPLVIYFASTILRSFKLTYFWSWPFDFLGLIVAFLSLLAICQAIIDGSEQEITVCYRLGFKKILSSLWVIVLSFFVVLGGICLGFIPGIVISVWVIFSLILVFSEGKHGLSALIKSRNYVRGYWWPILGRYLVFSLLLILLQILISAFLSIIGLNNISNYSNFNFSSTEEWTRYINILFNFLFFLPLQLSFVYGLYLQLKKIKGGEDEVSSSSPKTKNWFVGLGVLGVVIPIAFFFIALAFIAGVWGGDLLNRQIWTKLNLPANYPLFDFKATDKNISNEFVSTSTTRE